MSQALADNTKRGVQIREARERLGLSQIELAKLIPVDRAYLSELENGRVPVHDWVLDKVDKIEREREEEAALQSGRAVAPKPADLGLVLEAIASELDARDSMAVAQKITANPRISLAARGLCSQVFGQRAQAGKPAPDKIKGLNSELTAAQRADATRQQALARRAAQASSPSPKAASPNAGKAAPKPGTAARRKLRR